MNQGKTEKLFYGSASFAQLHSPLLITPPTSIFFLVTPREQRNLDEASLIRILSARIIYLLNLLVLPCAAMSTKRINRYILREISGPAVLSLLIFTFVLLMGRIPRLTELVINKGVPLVEIVKLFGFMLPTFLTITVPLSFLLAILLAFGRLSADSEYVALKASGINLYSLLKPVITLALLFAVLTGIMTNYIEPACKGAFRSKLFSIASSAGTLEILPGEFNDRFDGLVLLAQGVDEQRGTLQDIFISDEREGELPATIVAQQGQVISNANQLTLTLRLKNGTIHRSTQNQQKQTYQIIRFATYDVALDIGGQLSNKKRRISRSELSWGKLQEALKNASSERSRLRLAVELHERIVIAFAPLVLVLVGAPLGLQSQRSGKGAGFSLALVVFLVYYVLLSLASTIAEKGLLPAGIILWLPNICFLIIGIFFLQRTAKEKPVQLFTYPGRIKTFVMAKLTRGGNVK